MLEALSPSGVRIPTDRLLISALMALLAIATLGVVALVALDRMHLLDAIFFAAAPWVLLVAAFRPDWLLLVLIAAPATYTSPLQTKRLSLLIGVALVMLLVTRRRFSMGWATGLAALLTINIAGYLFHAEVGPDALAANAERMANLTLYILLALLAFNLALLGELDGDRLATALVIGVLTTLAVGYAGHGGAWFPSGPDVITKSRLGMLAAAALGVTLGRLFVAGDARRRNPGNLLMTGILLLLTIASFQRATWLAVVITFGLLALRLGRRGYVLILAMLVALALLTTTVRQEIARSEGDIVAELQTGEITTGRWELWTGLWDRAVPALPWGNGFGYTWSLSTEALFGEEGGWGTEEGGFVSPHNDFMYLFVEFGVPGFLLFILFWFALFRARRLVSESTDPVLRRSGWLFLGVIVAGLTLALFDSLTIRPFAERFFPVFGFIFGLGVLERARRRKPAGLQSPETTDEMAPAFRP